MAPIWRSLAFPGVGLASLPQLESGHWGNCLLGLDHRFSVARRSAVGWSLRCARPDRRQITVVAHHPFGRPGWFWPFGMGASGLAALIGVAIASAAGLYTSA
jgi:hypothetical protein